MPFRYFFDHGARWGAQGRTGAYRGAQGRSLAVAKQSYQKLLLIFIYENKFYSST